MIFVTESQQNYLDAIVGDPQRDEFVSSETAQILRERGVDAEAAYDLDLVPPGDPDDPDEPETDVETDLLDPQSERGRVFNDVSRILHDHHWGVGDYEAAGEQQRQTLQRFNPRAYAVKTSGAAAARNRSDEDVSKFGIEYGGSLNYNFAGGLINWAKIDDMPPEVALAQAALLEMYEELPNWTWAGTSRMLRNLAGDPFTYAGGVAGFKVVQQLIRGGGIAAVKSKLMQVALRGAGISAVGAEGSAYAMAGEYMNQRLKHGQEDEANLFRPDWNAIAAAGAVGFGVGSIAGATPLVPGAVRAGRDAFNRMAGDGTTLRSGIGPTNTRNFNREENAAFKAATERTETVVGKDGVEKQVVKVDRAKRQLAKQRAAEIRSNFAIDDGWREIRVNSVKFDKDGAPVITWKQPSYGYNKPPKGLTEDDHARNLADKMIDDVARVVGRAVTGDRAAIDIISQANWYRSMRTRLRAEFGGMADVFADLLGATSAQTGVEQNWNNSIEILRRFTRGEYDEEIKMYTDRLAAGETVNPTELAKLDKAGEFKLIRSAAGALFNTNSPAATGALLDMFRQVKQGAAPKTKNFTGNLIGYGRDATVDVWAARYLTDIAGLPRIPPPAEKAVTGGHRVGSTLENPQITGEFGFGQKVFEQAANDINASGVVKSFDPNLGDLGADDLQALVWFLEKEKWTKQGWTTKAGEGGSLDFEASLSGAADQAAIKEARRTATETFTPPARRKTETDEQYAMRVQDAESAAIAKQRNAEAVVDEMAAPLDRTVLGVARERPGQVPTNVQQAELAQELQAPVINDDSVVAFQTNNTVGEFAGETERALNAEYVTRSNFNPTALTQSLIDAGRKYDQDAVFISKVLREPTENSRPGVEIYFRQRQDVDFTQNITASLRKFGVDGFTFITDARQQDRADVQAMTDDATAGITGVRFQYIPEFDEAYDPARHAQIIAEKENLFNDVVADIANNVDIVQADVVHYDTQVFKRPTGTDWINGGMTYDEYVGAEPRAASGATRRGRLRGEAAAPPDRSEE